MKENDSNGRFAAAAKALSKIEPNELLATLFSALFLFVLMAAYYTLRPVRDAMASDWTDTEVSFLWTMNFFISASIVALYGFAVSRVRLRNVIPAVYGFFATSFVLFYTGLSFVADRELIDKAFYLWVSVFALFHVSVFWTFMADTFNKAQAKRLFAIIAMGATAGSIIGPAIPLAFAERLGNETLLLLASTALLLVIPLVYLIYYLKSTALGNDDWQADRRHDVMGGNWWRGFSDFLRNPFLLGIGAFILLYVFINSFVYFEQKNLLVEFSRVERTQILSGIDLLVNVLTFGLAFFVTGRIVGKLGMPSALALMPLLIVFGLLVLAFAPLLTVVLALQVVRRAGNYGLTRPAREMLFTSVSREERFKAKPVVDIVVYRGGDAAFGLLFAFLTEGIGLGLAAVAFVGAGVAAIWTWVGVRLGSAFDAKHDVDKQPESRITP